MRAVLWGAGGAMGRLIDGLLPGEVVGRVSLEEGYAHTGTELGDVGADTVIDFSHHSSVADMLAYAKKYHCCAVIGTTGHTEEERALILSADIPVFYSGNMSLGIALLCRMARQAAAAFPGADIEILEVHHTRKVDAPSGTALMLARSVQAVRPQAVIHCGRAGEGRREKTEIGISSLRMGNVVGIHEIHICTPQQTLTLRHEAHTRDMLAQGAVEAARYMQGKTLGIYNMEHLLEETT